MNQIEIQDITALCDRFAFKEEIKGKTFMITGTTGLLGGTLTHFLLGLGLGIKVLAPVRSLGKAEAIYSPEERRSITFVECDLATYDYATMPEADYAVHCAAPTSGKYFVEHPVETFDIILEGTRRFLGYVRERVSERALFVSSMEVYGVITDDAEPVKESSTGYLDAFSARSCYPMAKRAAEHLCYLYAEQYGTEISIVRPALTTGASLAASDNRMIAQFARSIARREDIVLHTTGESSRPYLYATDAVEGMMYALLRGGRGEAYNLANEATYMSARGLAEYLVKEYGSINYRIELNDSMGYAPPTKLRLDTSKLRALGWSPRHDMRAIYDKLLQVLS